MSTPPKGKLALPELAAMKKRGEKIVMVTAYDAPGARFAEDAGVELRNGLVLGAVDDDERPRREVGCGLRGPDGPVLPAPRVERRREAG